MSPRRDVFQSQDLIISLVLPQQPSTAWRCQLLPAALLLNEATGSHYLTNSVSPISLQNQKCSRVRCHADTLYQRRGQEVNFLNELSFLPPSLLRSAYFVLSSSDLQVLELLFFLWTCSSSNVPPRRPNTSENQRRKKPGGRGRRRGRGDQEKKISYRTAGDRITVTWGRQPLFHLCHLKKTRNRSKRTDLTSDPRKQKQLFQQHPSLLINSPQILALPAHY